MTSSYLYVIDEKIHIYLFSDTEETQVGLFGIVPFSIEAEFKRLGAVYEEADPWNPKVILSFLK